jgi:hypothetical protein
MWEYILDQCLVFGSGFLLGAVVALVRVKSIRKKQEKKPE